MILEIFKQRKLTLLFSMPTSQGQLQSKVVLLKVLPPLLPAAPDKSRGLTTDCLRCFKHLIYKGLVGWSHLLCRGFIVLEGKYFVLEPTPGRSDGTHRIYSAEHLHFSSGTCGHSFNISSSSAADGTSEGRNPFRSFSSRVRVTADDELFSTLLADPLELSALWPVNGFLVLMMPNPPRILLL